MGDGWGDWWETGETGGEAMKDGTGGETGGEQMRRLEPVRKKVRRLGPVRGLVRRR